MSTRFPVGPGGLRVFRGYQRPDLSEADFLKELGEVFMPGTPLMLRDLGLAAYMPAVVSKSAVPNVPDEVAIIAYASDEAYKRARNESIVGRLYTHTHRGVFDMAASRSQPPTALTSFTAPVTAFYCYGNPVDWQTDGEVVVYIAEARGPNPTPFGDRAVQDLRRLCPQLEAHGVLECVGEVAETWFAIWFLIRGFDETADDLVRRLVKPMNAYSKELLLAKARRLVWRDDPPPAPVERPSAWTYIFERAARQFLT